MDVKRIHDWIILTIQVVGFMTALIMLPFVHDWIQGVFIVGFTTHFVGDIFRLKKDGVI